MTPENTWQQDLKEAFCDGVWMIVAVIALIMLVVGGYWGMILFGATIVYISHVIVNIFHFPEKAVLICCLIVALVLVVTIWNFIEKRLSYSSVDDYGPYDDPEEDYENDRRASTQR